MIQFTEEKATQVALEIAKWEKWPVLFLCTGSWLVANVLWVSYISGYGQIDDREVNPSELLHSGKTSLLRLICHVDACVPKSCVPVKNIKTLSK